MQTLVLSPENAGLPLKSLIDQVGSEDIQICDASGKVLAYLTSPASHEDKLYAAAEAAFMVQRDIIEKRAQTRGGISTKELCRRVGMPYHGDSAEAE